MVRSFDKDSRKGSDGTFPLSNAPTDTVSIPDMSPRPSLSSLDEPDWPQTWRAYFCLTGCFFLMFNSWGLVNAYGTWSSYYVGHSLLGTDQLKLNLIGSTQSFLVLLLSNPVGRLLDAGYSRHVIGFGSVMVPLGLFLLSVVHPSELGVLANFGTVWGLQGFLVGLGMAPFFVSSSQVAATWFPKRRGLAVGYVACGASVAGVVYPTMLRYLILELGFNNAVRCVAGLTTVTCLFSFIFATPNPAHDHHEPKSWASKRTWFDTDAKNNKAFWWFTAAVAFMFFGFYPIFFNIEEWAAVLGYGTRDGVGIKIAFAEETDRPIETFWLLTIMNGASTAGRLLLAHFCDKVGALNMHSAAQITCSLLVLILWPLAGSENAAIAFCVVFGLFSGTVIGCPPASMANILNCTYSSPEDAHFAKKKLGHWTGMMYSFAAIPALTGPLIAGHMITTYNTYLTLQMWSGSCLLLSFVCMLFARWYLPCLDGEMVSIKLARKLGRHVDPTREKSCVSDVAFDERLSQAPTRVQSQMPSRQISREKVDQPERMV
ncbi:major facilitator superfamily domain-containing protein [Ampelomyces quisqualis]|uniref:Major facilitator superfamily domain-containing protein n=1 Tax=Ampelomyces quisqualis TaxID=50730 RepID=A0A6A5QY03_AMPQU|nr:major facilitator superfamily domain-containing protein [Ampelomyces quisqualis]